MTVPLVVNNESLPTVSMNLPSPRIPRISLALHEWLKFSSLLLVMTAIPIAKSRSSTDYPPVVPKLTRWVYSSWDGKVRELYPSTADDGDDGIWALTLDYSS